MTGSLLPGQASILPTSVALTIATSQLEQAWRMAKGLHFLRARLQVLHYRMLGAASSPGRVAIEWEWVDDLAGILRAGSAPVAVAQALSAAQQKLKDIEETPILR